MKMAAAVDEFGKWLTDKLKILNIDESVFGSYISGILDGDETREEKKEALEGILSDIIESDIVQHVDEIMDKWASCQPALQDVASSSAVDAERLVKLLGSQTLATAVPRSYTDDEKKIKQAILSQYSQLSDEEDDDVACAPEGDKDLMRNTNASTVAAAARERREQAKQDSQRKKEKDKEDREKQKQLKEEKKEKRKTMKNERKR